VRVPLPREFRAKGDIKERAKCRRGRVKHLPEPRKRLSEFDLIGLIAGFRSLVFLLPALQPQVVLLKNQQPVHLPR
jgi:hypothetical protein